MTDEQLQAYLELAEAGMRTPEPLARISPRTLRDLVACTQAERAARN